MLSVKRTGLLRCPKTPQQGLDCCFAGALFYHLMVTSGSTAVTLAHNCALPPLIHLLCIVYAGTAVASRRCSTPPCLMPNCRALLHNNNSRNEHALAVVRQVVTTHPITNRAAHLGCACCRTVPDWGRPRPYQQPRFAGPKTWASGLFHVMWVLWLWSPCSHPALC
jgi:hypothetical protein